MLKETYAVKKQNPGKNVFEIIERKKYTPLLDWRKKGRNLVHTPQPISHEKALASLRWIVAGAKARKEDVLFLPD